MIFKYLNSTAMFEAPDDKGSNKVPPVDPKKVAAEERASIKVETSPAGSDNNNNEEVNEENEEENEELEEENNKENNENETPEQKTARIAQEKLERKDARIQRRIDRLTAESGNKDKEIEKLKQQLSEKVKEGLTEEEVERRAAEKAKKIAEDEAKANNVKEFEKTANKLLKDAGKEDKEFEKRINDVALDTDIKMPMYMIEILSDLENKNGHEILIHLSNDPDLYEEVCQLTERQMTRKLDKLSEELKAVKVKSGKKTVNQERPRVPSEPIEPINDGNNNRGNQLPTNPTKNMDDFARIRAAQVEARAKARNAY